MLKSKLKKTVTLLLALIVISTFAIDTYAITPKQWLTYSWKIISKSGDLWFHRDPTSVEGYNADYMSSGDIEFNKGDYGPTVYHAVTVEDVDNWIEMFAQTNFLNWSKKIALVLFDPDGDEVKSLAVTHNQRLIYGMDEGNISTGNYRAQFVSTDSIKWDLWIYMSHWNGSESESSSTYSLKSKDNNTQTKAYMGEDKLYFVPSENRKSDIQTDKATSLNMSELSLQIYDDSAKVWVNDFKDYEIGDFIYFEDTISNLWYDETSKATHFVFKDFRNDDVEWIFNNDLTDKYSIGGKLSLKFEVVEEYSTNDYIFETLDYIKEASKLTNSGKYASLNKYTK